MKKVVKGILTAALALLLNAEMKAQGVKLPQPSSGQTLIQDFGLGKITLTYSRPNVKGRKIFGGLELYGNVWRTGANSATTIKFTEDVSFEGKPVPAGEYALFTIPDKNEWTVILNKSTKQWGAYEYKVEEDFLRVKIKPETLKEKVETFALQFKNVYPTKADLQLMWENTAIRIGLTTDIDTKVMASIEEAMKGEKKPYFQAAQYYYENGKDLTKALEWMNAAEATDPKGPWIRLWKGKIQLKLSDKKGAATSAEAGLQLAKESKNEEYIRLNTALLTEAKK